MGIEVPTLDDWEYAEIIEDARRRLPTYSETWTDHNATDPGITILELLAWLSETYTYQLDQVTDAHRRKYVQLMGEQIRPPQPAQVDLKVQLPKSVDRVAIGKGTPIKAKESSGKTRVFETTEDVVLTRSQIDRVISDSEQGRINNTTANATEGMHFLAFGEHAEPGSRMYLGFERDPFVKRFDKDPLEPISDDDPLTTGTLAIHVDFHEADLPSPAVHGESSTGCNEPARFKPSVDLKWEYCVGSTELTENNHWKELSVQKDETDRLYHGGTVRLERPASWDFPKKKYLWIRCTVEEGGYEIPPPLIAIRTNVVTADQRATITEEELRSTEGEKLTTALPGQVFTFEHTPVLEADIEINGKPWEKVTDFDASQSNDRHYVLDEEQGEIQFGDGIRGMIPPAGNVVRVKQYKSGGGIGGNMSEATSWEFGVQDRRIRGSKMRFQRRLENVVIATGPATGGTDAESVEAALKRIRKDRTTPYRAVSAEDYQSVAMYTPGLRFGRAVAHVVSGDEIADERSQEVRVVVIPYGTTEKPTPSAGFTEAVQEHLDRHRLLTDRVKVEPPKYVGVGVDTEIYIDPGYSTGGRTAAVTDRLNDFLDPLHGFEGGGWPVGRPLYRSELYETIEDVEGIDYILDITVRTQNEQAIDSRGTVTIDETALLYPMGHKVTVRRDPPDERGEL